MKTVNVRDFVPAKPDESPVIVRDRGRTNNIRFKVRFPGDGVGLGGGSPLKGKRSIGSQNSCGDNLLLFS